MNPASLDPPRLPSDAELQIPQGADPESAIIGPVAGRYDLEDRIARGGMGIIYKAHDRQLNRTVAVKVLRGRYMDRPDLIRRFLAEARINGRLQHPGIVPVYYVGTLDDTRPFIAMKLVEGQTLARLLRERNNPAENQGHYLKVFETLCHTLAYAHQQGVIHRDLKPDNIMVGAFGEVQVMDWGLAKFLDPAMAVAPTPDGFDAIERSAYLSDERTSHTGDFPTQATAVEAVAPDDPNVMYTTAGEVFGTLAFMPPEQARGETDRMDRRGDVFSLGAILCQLLTGQPPYFGPPDTLREQAREGRLFGAYLLLDRCGADPALVLLAKHCLTVDADARPADAGVLAAMVTQCLESLQDRTRQLEVRRITAETRLVEAEAKEGLARRARHLARMLAAAGVIVAGLLAAGLGWYANDRIAREHDESRRRDAAIAEIEESLAVAETIDAEARASKDPPIARDAVARQAVAATHQAETLLGTTARPPQELVERSAQVKARVVETERGIRLALALEEWRTELFDAKGNYDPEAAVRRSRELLDSYGFRVFDREPASVAEELRTHPAGSAIIAVLADWMVVTHDPRDRETLGNVLKAADAAPPREWVAALSGDDDAALAKLVDAPIDHVPPAAFAVASRRLVRAGRADDAGKLLARGVRRHPTDFTLNAHLGTMLRHQPATRTDAVRYLTAARVARPDDAGVKQELSLALADIGRDDEAVEVLKGAGKSDAVHVRLGDAQLARGEADAAKASYRQALDANPANVAAQVGLGRAELLRKDIPAAESAFRAAGDLPAAAAGLGRVHLARWEASKAIAAFTRAIKGEPKVPDHRLGLVESHRMANDLAAALQAAKQATTDLPESIALWKMLGETAKAAKDNPAALAAYREAVRRDAADASLHRKVGELSEESGDLPGAAAAYAAASALLPDDKDLRGKAERAKLAADDRSPTALRRRVEADPMNKSLRLELGRALVAQGDESGLPELEQSGDALALAEGALQLGKFRKAATAYRAAADATKDESQSAKWRTQSRTALRWAALEARLPDVIAGTWVPETASAWSDFANIAQRTRKHVAAIKLFESANDPTGVATNQALAGFGWSTDGDTLTPDAMADLRRKALSTVGKDPMLSRIASSSVFAKLPAEERAAWSKAIAP